jgi:hypothetical protein
MPQDHIRARNMAQSNRRETQSPVEDVALIVGGGPGISSSCARLFTEKRHAYRRRSQESRKGGP